MNKSIAEQYAIAALNWLSENPMDLKLFLDQNGASINDVRIRAAEPEFLTFVLDFFLTSDQLVVELSNHLNIKPENLSLARDCLGGTPINWT